MAKKIKEYHKLPGKKKGFLVGRYTVWQGSDHLLHIYSRMGVEDYKRFYFSDIQAMITRKTAAGKVQNGILGGLILLFLLPAATLGGGWSIFYAIVTASLLLLLLVNWVRGPTCETRIMTAVQTEKMHSMNRLKNAMKAMDRLRSYIEQAQGALTSENLNKMDMRRPVNRAAAGAARRADLRKKASKKEKGNAHMILFALLLFEGVLVTFGFFFKHVALTVLGTAASLTMGIFVTVALVKQHDSDITASLRAITWTTLGFVCISLAAGYAITTIFVLKYPRLVYDQWALFKIVSAVSPWENPLFLSFDIFTLSGALFLGIPGLIMLKRYQNSGMQAAAAATVIAGQPAVAG